MGSVQVRKTVIGGYPTREEWRTVATTPTPHINLDYLCALLGVDPQTADWNGHKAPVSKYDGLWVNCMGEPVEKQSKLLLDVPGQLWDTSKHDAYMVQWYAEDEPE